ncbi:modin [Colletotrichum chrysophilum]|uniref:Modin n=1 Tax=Colletotrichum chrysophilum TaxID=1836956 RepID=A0AAD9ENB3_9PEZI|nr:modin [Colletotrichum chrysophilum]
MLMLRNHIQEVLAGLNEGTISGTQVDVMASGSLTPSPTWKELDHIPPELKEAKLMEIYFRIVCPKVVAEMEKFARDLDVSLPAESHDHSTNRVVEDKSRGNLDNIPLWMVENVTCEDIWCTLMFRSICWLMLHDFHPDDMQIPKSDLFGSRLPVYIA